MVNRKRRINWLHPIKGLLCKHKNITKNEVCKGATLSWTARATHAFIMHEQCLDCGTKWESSSYIYLGDYHRNNGWKFDTDGWPLDMNGKRLPIAVY